MPFRYNGSGGVALATAKSTIRAAPGTMCPTQRHRWRRSGWIGAWSMRDLLPSLKGARGHVKDFSRLDFPVADGPMTWISKTVRAPADAPDCHPRSHCPVRRGDGRVAAALPPLAPHAPLAKTER